jgi:hypothetical protein
VTALPRSSFQARPQAATWNPGFCYAPEQAELLDNICVRLVCSDGQGKNCYLLGDGWVHRPYRLAKQKGEDMRNLRLTAAFILSAAIIALVPGSGLSQLKAPAGTAVTSPLTRPALPPKVAYAGTTLECGNKSYHVTVATRVAA